MFRIIYPSFIKPTDILVKDLPLIERRSDSVAKMYRSDSQKSFYNKGKLFVFDPNKVRKEQLIELGLKEKTAGVLIKFRSKGFVFRKKEDLKKVFGITDKLYERLAPYILIDPIHTKTQQQEKTVLKNTGLKIIELNSADSLLLLEANGIGPSFAKRILKYRSLLGGFVLVEQLKEVYGFTEEMYGKLRSQIKVDSSLVKKLDLNKDDFKVINKHPYLSYELTKEICNKRRKGIITQDNLEEIITDEVLLKKLLPYLDL